MLIYAYYTNLTPSDKALFEKYHTYYNDLFNDILEILKEKVEHINGFPHLRMITIFNLSIRKLKMVKANILPVRLDLDIKFNSCPGLIDHKHFFPRDISFTTSPDFLIRF